jgi:CBS domain containing-hemolysin-like protein
VARQLSENSYEFAGRMEIEEINERFHLDLPESDDYQTIAGYLLHLQEAIPAVGERIDTELYEFEVIRKTAARIELVKLTVKDNE